MRKRIAACGGMAALALFGPLAGTALAQTTEEVAAAVDNLWVVVAAILVMFMQPGFALVEAGFTRAKNTANIVMKNFMDFAAGALMYWAIGFGLAYGGSTIGGYIGYGEFFFANPERSVEWFFQVVFAATAATIVSGAMAERTKFTAYLVYTPFITGLIYPIVTHWTWGGGWLSELGYYDFAGSGIVHMVGGTAALAGVLALGPRIGKYDSDGNPQPIPGHSLMLGALGVFILWFGWYGFNAGSTLAAVGADIGTVAVTTTLAAAAGAVGAMAVSWASRSLGRPDPGMTLNGALGGLVGITAAPDIIPMNWAVVVGLVAGAIIVRGILLIEKAGIDDPVGAITVHGVCGMWGVLSVGIFGADIGLLNGGGLSQLGIQVVGIAAIGTWTFVSSSIVFRGLDAAMGLRVSAVEELAGLDRIEHGASAYPEFMEQIADPRELDPVP
jgi:ammonium transporter, Amt family